MYTESMDTIHKYLIQQSASSKMTYQRLFLKRGKGGEM